MQEFEKELRSLINRHSVENKWDMPDMIMARLICDFIKGTSSAMKWNLDWHGVDNPCHRQDKDDTPLEHKTGAGC